jgi:hypothetical protein
MAILTKSSDFTDSFLDINNDIFRIITAFNKDDELKKLLVNTDFKPLQGSIVDKDLRDKQISRAPLLPYDDEEGSIVTVTFINGELDSKSESMGTTLAVDVFTPGNQWIIAEGIRPLMIAHAVNNIMKHKLNQTGGVKYRLTDVINAQLSDTLIGYRLIYIAVIDD